MFTGIVASLGRITARTEIPGGVSIDLECPVAARAAAPGASISVDGCCLTVTQVEGSVVRFELSRETLRRTIASRYRVGATVNLESALRSGDRFGGHFVTGHVDIVARVESLERDGEFATLEVGIERVEPGMVAEKGSIAVNGVSLTVASWESLGPGGRFTAALIPETLERTNLGALAPGQDVNIEFDLLARYVAEALKRTVAHV